MASLGENRMESLQLGLHELHPAGGAHGPSLLKPKVSPACIGLV